MAHDFWFIDIKGRMVEIMSKNFRGPMNTGLKWLMNLGCTYWAAENGQVSFLESVGGCIGNFIRVPHEAEKLLA